MRILIGGAVLRKGWPGGEPISTRLLAEDLRNLGHEVSTGWFDRGVVGLVGFGTSPFDWDLLALNYYSRLLTDEKPDVVLCHYDYDTSLIRASRKAGIPAVACVHTHWPTCPIGTLYIEAEGVCDGSEWRKCISHMSKSIPPTHGRFKPSWLPAPLALPVYQKFRNRRQGLAQASAIVAISQAQKDILVAAGFQRVNSVPIGIDHSEFQGVPESDSPPVVLYPAGSIIERKGFFHFHRLAKTLSSRFPSVQFIAPGFSGDQFVRGTGYLARETYVALMLRAKVVVVPPLWSEPFGRVVLEAMAAAKPVAGYASGALPEVIEDGITGLLSPVGDLPHLVSNVTSLLEDPRKAREMGEAGRRRVERFFNVRMMTNGYLRIIRGVLRLNSR